MSDLEASIHKDPEIILKHVNEPAQKGFIGAEIENGILLVTSVEDKDERGASGTNPQIDPNIVNWNSEYDPGRAINWTTTKKSLNLAIITSIALLGSLASSMVAPDIPLILKDFDTTNETLGAMVISIYILGYAFGPLVIAPMSEIYGRYITYQVNNILFVVWTIACALAPNIGALLAFRVFAGIAGSCAITIGAGSVADLFVQENRGGAMAVFAFGPLLAPVFGPIAGGYLSEAKGWRWTFWVIAIASGVACIGGVVFLQETYEPVLLQRRTNKLRKKTGNQDLRSQLESNLSAHEYLVRALVRPTKMLLFSPIVLTLSMYTALVYGYLYLLFTTLTMVFEQDYGISQAHIGLTFLGVSIGSLLGLAVFGVTSDKIVKKLSVNGEMKPEYRLPPLILGSLLISIGLFWYGWSAERHIQWIMPIIGTFLIGIGLVVMFMPIQTYLVDAFPTHAASAIAADTVLRSMVGAFLPLAGPSMYAALGLGWGNSLLAFIALAFTPVGWIFFKYGERMRKSNRFQVTF